jgi:hypothetical protein
VSVLMMMMMIIPVLCLNWPKAGLCVGLRSKCRHAMCSVGVRRVTICRAARVGGASGSAWRQEFGEVHHTWGGELGSNKRSLQCHYYQHTLK